jgi:hypothetical protein
MSTNDTQSLPEAAYDEQNDVRSWLIAKKLGTYADVFDEQGYDDLDILLALDSEGFKKLCRLASIKPGHIEKLKRLLPHSGTSNYCIIIRCCCSSWRPCLVD